ncbi:MAG TPA: DUF4369 domain-containing protein [Puia sp.]|nr:DUF4369 domain-containing protein [Puia sp.]
MKTKNIVRSYYMIITLSFIFPLVAFQMPPNGYTITGHIEGLKEGEKVKMSLMSLSPINKETRDSSYVVNGKFTITGYVPDGPRLYYMEFGDHPSKVAGFVIDNEKNITITSKADIGNMATEIRDFLDIDGSDSYHDFEKAGWGVHVYARTLAFINRAIDKVRDSLGYDQKILDGLMMSREAATNAFYNYTVENFPNNKALPLLLLNYTGYIGHEKFLGDYYEKMDEATKNSSSGKKLKLIADLCIGHVFPPFSLSDVEGKVVTSKNIFPKNKLTIVQFWASTSVERSRLQKELKALYGKFHNKGLGVVGISSDSTAMEWKLRMQGEQLPWINVSDLKGSDGVVQNVYHEYSGDSGENINTVNVLVDSEGKIIAWDIDGIKLQWYLIKYLGQ